MGKTHVTSRLRRRIRRESKSFRHERMIASVVASQPDPADRFALGSLFSMTLKRDNPRLDVDRFMAECGIKDWRNQWAGPVSGGKTESIGIPDK